MCPETMSHIVCKGYVLSKEIRYSFFVGGIVAVLAMASFSGFMFYVAFTQTHSQQSCTLVAVVFLLLTVYFAYTWFHNVKIANMRYTIGDGYVTNCCGKKALKHEIVSTTKIERTSFRFVFAKSQMDINFWVVTNERFPHKTFSGDIGLKALHTLWQHNVIILPFDNVTSNTFACGDDRYSM